MKVLGIDVGDKRIGLAVSDELGTVAAPLETIERLSDEDAMNRIARAVRDHTIGEVVVGVPYAVDGSKGPQAVKTIRFAEKLRLGLEVPVRLWDESLSTRRASELRRGRSKSRSKKGERDRLAAAFILQDYLNSGGEGRSKS